jgi:hypothetical protein
MTIKCIEHTFTAQGQEHRLLVDGKLRWINEHAGMADNAILRASGCSLLPPVDEAIRLVNDKIRLAHLSDDMEIMRTRCLRATRAHKELLSDALAALLAGDLDVTQEFLTRTIDGLITDEAKLREIK